ncbi:MULTISPECIES: hypothetical protein [Sandaracinus]|uniref:hypothetical protein n=1 Tax=Sandaracinus TaxID=1055688 RepID=UPI0019D48757|nr:MULTISPECIES: hypothetical protein [Sandaracinus]UJR87320.1 Hypothetical protein I5071_1120 [Sandaracinus amylolyticus]
MSLRLTCALVAVVWVHPEVATATPRVPALGDCFESVDAFVQQTWGAAALGDENIVRRIAAPIDDGSVWVVDQTATANPSWFLLQPRLNDTSALCLSLQLDHAAHAEITRVRAGWRIEAVEQAPPGFAARRWRYLRRDGTPRFRLVGCEAVLALPDGGVERSQCSRDD